MKHLQAIRSLLQCQWQLHRQWLWKLHRHGRQAFLGLNSYCVVLVDSVSFPRHKETDTQALGPPGLSVVPRLMR